MIEAPLTVEILPDGIKVQARVGEVLADVLARAGIPLSLYCHQRGICGKCAIRILSGPLPFPTAIEAAMNEGRGLGPDHRLACLYVVQSDVVVETLPGSRLEGIAVLDADIPSAVFIDPAVKKLPLVLDKPSLYSPTAVVDSLRATLKSPGLVLPLAVLSKLGGAALTPARTATAVFYDEREILDIEFEDAQDEAFGLAVDLGTSTVAAELVDLRTGRVVDRAAAVNAQNSYGADVVSRITFAFENPENLRRLKAAAVHLINDLVGAMSRRSGVPLHRIYEAVVAGNTAMNHILCGVSVDPLALAPFQAVFSVLPALPASEIGLALHPQARVYIVPNVKSFVGGDITAGLMASDFAAKAATELFIDLGTNGEIVLKRGAEFVTTSTAVGPAFEGMNISCGMLAVSGAVYKAEWAANGFKLHTVDNVPPQGVCGTGLVDVLALALDHGILGRDGRLAKREKKIRLSDRLDLTQQDVRDVQLAVAAIRTGVRLMLNEFRVTADDLDRVLVAGAFGSTLDIGNAVSLGILPDIPRPKIVFIGNASLAGARLLLLSRPKRADAEMLAAKISHISLATRPDFQDEFVQALEFSRYPRREK